MTGRVALELSQVQDDVAPSTLPLGGFSAVKSTRVLYPNLNYATLRTLYEHHFKDSAHGVSCTVGFTSIIRMILGSNFGRGEVVSTSRLSFLNVWN